MANIKNNCSSMETQRRLIDAAGEIFAERGLDGSTIQDITERAGTSLASVNYHFHGKTGLYQHVIAEAYRVTTDLFRQMQTRQDQTPQQQMSHYIDAILKLMMDADHSNWQCVLLNREVQHPNQIDQEQIKGLVQVAHGSLGQIITKLIGRPVDDRELMLCTHCVIGLCKYFVDHREFNVSNFPGMPSLYQNRMQLVEHITSFCITAIKGMYD